MLAGDVKRLPSLLLALLISLALGLATAQERHNAMAVDGVLTSDAAGPYYFLAWGDSSNAYASAAPFARALGAELAFDDATKVLTFRRGDTEVRLAATGEPGAGLARRPGALKVNGAPRDSFLGILQGGVAYVPVTPIVQALGGEAEWIADMRLVDIAMPSTAPTLPMFRTGLHGDYARVAIDLPPGQPYRVAVGGRTLVVTFPGAAVGSGSWRADTPHLAAARYDEIDGVAALILETGHELLSSGAGFRTGVGASGALYVDVGASLRGEGAAALLEPDAVPDEPLAAAPAPPARRVVVIDPGHGGRFAGAQGYVAEEDVVLEVAFRLKALLEAHGIEVEMTRDADVHLAADRTADLGVRADHATPDTNLFVSIHANAVASPKANGIETFVFGRQLDPELIRRAIEENGGGALGEALTEQARLEAAGIDGDIFKESQLNNSLALAERVQRELIARTGAVDRGVKQNYLYVLRKARTPAILVELGFVTHPTEGRRLGQADYQQALADAIGTGILDFLGVGGDLAHR